MARNHVEAPWGQHKGADDPCKIVAVGALPTGSTNSFPPSHLGEGGRLFGFLAAGALTGLAEIWSASREEAEVTVRANLLRLLAAHEAAKA